MAEPARFSYTTVIEPTGARLLRPIVPIGLTYSFRSSTCVSLETQSILKYAQKTDLAIKTSRLVYGCQNSTDTSSPRVVRCGSWHNVFTIKLRTAFRDADSPSFENSNYRFRCARAY